MKKAYYVHVEEKNLPIWPAYVRLDGSLEATNREKTYNCDLATMCKGKVFRELSWEHKTREGAFKSAYQRLEAMIKEYLEFGSITGRYNVYTNYDPHTEHYFNEEQQKRNDALNAIGFYRYNEGYSRGNTNLTTNIFDLKQKQFDSLIKKYSINY